MYNGIIFIIFVVVGFFVCKRNYAKRSSSLSNNLIEFLDEIILKYESLTPNDQKLLLDKLNTKEYDMLTALMDKKLNLSKNLNQLQTNMYIFEDISRKMKTLED